MFEYVGNLKYQDVLESTFEIKLEELKEGINLFDNYFIVKEKNIEFTTENVTMQVAK